MSTRDLPSWLLRAADLLAAAAIPFLVLGLLCASSWLRAHGQGWSTLVLGVVLLFVGFFGGFFSMVLYVRFGSCVEFFLSGAVSITMLVGADAIAVRITDEALLERGAEETCELLGVESRTVTTTTRHSDGTTSTSTRTVYDHALDCPERGLQELTLGYAAGSEGEGVAIVHDPLDRIGPVPADILPDGPPPVWPWWLLASVAALRVGHVTVFHALAGPDDR